MIEHVHLIPKSIPQRRLQAADEDTGRVQPIDVADVIDSFHKIAASRVDQSVNPLASLLNPAQYNNHGDQQLTGFTLVQKRTLYQTAMHCLCCKYFIQMHISNISIVLLVVFYLFNSNTHPSQLILAVRILLMQIQGPHEVKDL